MSNNVTVSNSFVSNNPDIPVRTTDVGTVNSPKHIQHVRIDVGSGSSEEIWDGNVSASFSPTKESAITTESVISVQDSSTSVLSSNPDRTVAWVKNISSQPIFVSLSATATTSKPTKLLAGESLALGNGMWCYTGAVSAIHADTGHTHNLEVVEL